MKNKKPITLVGLSAVILAGCSSLQSTLNCPDDPFDPSASGTCRLLYSKNQQQNVIAGESSKTAGLKNKGDQIAADKRVQEAELVRLEKEAVSLRAQLKRQETRTRAAEEQLRLTKISGEKSAKELVAIEEKLASIQGKIRTASLTRGSSPDEVALLKRLKSELDNELDQLLDEL